MTNPILRLYRFGISLVSNTQIHKIPLVMTIHKAIIKRIVPRMVVIDGHKIYLDKNDFLYLSTRTLEPFEKQLIEDLVYEGDTVLDIGASIGYFTLILARKVGPKGKVYAFEPDPEICAILRKNIMANNYTNVVVVEKAVYDVTSTTKMNTYNDKGDSAIISDTGTVVDTIRIDEYIKDKVDFIKMDIEGSDGIAYTGMIETIRKNSDIKMLGEYCPPLLKGQKIDAEKYYELIKSEGFKIYNIIEDKKQLVPIHTYKELIEYCDAGRQKFTNILCIRGGK